MGEWPRWRFSKFLCGNSARSNTSTADYMHVDHITFRQIVMTLHMCDAIIEES